MEDAAVQETVDHLFHIGPKKPVSGGEPLVIDLLQRLKVILNALIVLRLLRLSGPVDRGCVGQFPSPGKKLKTNPTRHTVSLPESQWPRAEGARSEQPYVEKLPFITVAIYECSVKPLDPLGNPGRAGRERVGYTHGSARVKNDVTRNPLVWSALGLCTALLTAAVYLPGISTALTMVPPGIAGWGLILGMSLIPLLIGQIVKQIRG